MNSRTAQLIARYAAVLMVGVFGLSASPELAAPVQQAVSDPAMQWALLLGSAVGVALDHWLHGRRKQQ